VRRYCTTKTSPYSAMAPQLQLIYGDFIVGKEVLHYKILE